MGGACGGTAAGAGAGAGDGAGAGAGGGGGGAVDCGEDASSDWKEENRKFFSYGRKHIVR